jgi:16S rRNA (uracil1498-N3)-methyltransferase
MTASHFFVDSLSPGTVFLSHEDTAHALRSRRMRSGEPVTVADGRGAVGRGRLAGERNGLAAVDVEEVWRQPAPTPFVSVAVAAPKGDRLAWTIQKLAEIGVGETMLVHTERSVREWDEPRVDRAMDRLRSVAKEAAMQSRQPFIMKLEGPCPLSAALDGSSVMLTEGARDPLQTVLPADPEVMRLVVGPEGGFADAEVEQANRSGAAVASLGPAILRTETAAVVGAALVLARYGRLG